MKNFYKELNNRDKRETGTDITSLVEKLTNIHKDNDLKNEVEKKDKMVNNKKDIDQYIDTTGELSSKNLKLYLWLSKHKVFFYRFAIVFLIICIILSFGYSIFKISDYAIFGFNEDQIIYQDLATSYDYTGIHPRYSPKPLQILETNILESGINKYDLIAEVYNSNKWFRVEFDYYFIVDGAETQKKHAIFMPSEARPIGILGVESEIYIGSNNFILENVVWKRISRHEISDIDSWMQERMQFQVYDVEFIRAGGSNNLGSHVIKFNVLNNGAFSYKTPLFYIGLYQNNSLIGLMPVQFDNFYALEVKSVDLRSFAPNLSVSEIELYPIIDLFDDEVYTQK